MKADIEAQCSEARANSRLSEEDSAEATFFEAARQFEVASRRARQAEKRGVRDGEISVVGLEVLGALLDFDRKRPSVAVLAHYTGRSEGAIRRGIAKLRELLIIREDSSVNWDRFEKTE